MLGMHVTSHLSAAVPANVINNAFNDLPSLHPEVIAWRLGLRVLDLAGAIPPYGGQLEPMQISTELLLSLSLSLSHSVSYLEKCDTKQKKTSLSLIYHSHWLTYRLPLNRQRPPCSCG